MGLKMNDNNSYAEKYFRMLQEKVELAQKENKPIKDLVEKQIAILEASHDEFVANVKAEGVDMANPKVGEIEVRQFTAMKQLAEKIGLPVEKYDKMIKDVRVRIFGEDNVKNFFGENS